jgi:hypothetical protein
VGALKGSPRGRNVEADPIVPARGWGLVDRDRWCDDFVDELIKLRPHVSHKLARTLALHQYDAKEHPRDKARQYDKAQRGESAVKKGKRPK